MFCGIHVSKGNARSAFSCTKSLGCATNCWSAAKCYSIAQTTYGMLPSHWHVCHMPPNSLPSPVPAPHSFVGGAKTSGGTSQASLYCSKLSHATHYCKVYCERTCLSFLGTPGELWEGTNLCPHCTVLMLTADKLCSREL